MENHQSEINKGLKFAELETANKGKLASFMRTHILDQNYMIVVGVFKAAYVKHGGEVDSPIHSIRSCIDNVTKALVKAKENKEHPDHKKAITNYSFEGGLGIRKIDGEYTLVDKGSKPKKKMTQEAVKKLAGTTAKKLTTVKNKTEFMLAMAEELGMSIEFK